jgi:hypothetical protein
LDLEVPNPNDCGSFTENFINPLDPYTTWVRHMEYYVGPRKVTSNGKDNVILYLGKDFKHLIGKRVMLIVKVLDEENGVRT